MAGSSLALDAPVVGTVADSVELDSVAVHISLALPEHLPFVPLVMSDKLSVDCTAEHYSVCFQF